MTHYVKLFALAAALCVAATACSLGGDEDARQGGDNVDTEQQAISDGLDRLLDGQPVPVFDWSQERETLNGILEMRAQGTVGTAVARSIDGTILWWCPTLGGPIPSTYQITSGSQYADLPNDQTRTRFQIEQAEPTGVYPGDSAATWVLCTDDNGIPFAQYEEANVEWTSGTLDLPADLRVTPGEITYEFATEGD